MFITKMADLGRKWSLGEAVSSGYNYNVSFDMELRSGRKDDKSILS